MNLLASDCSWPSAATASRSPTATASRAEADPTTVAGSSAWRKLGSGRVPRTESTAILSGTGFNSAIGLASSPTPNRTARWSQYGRACRISRRYSARSLIPGPIVAVLSFLAKHPREARFIRGEGIVPWRGWPEPRKDPLVERSLHAHAPDPGSPRQHGPAFRPRADQAVRRGAVLLAQHLDAFRGRSGGRDRPPRRGGRVPRKVAPQNHAHHRSPCRSCATACLMVALAAMHCSTMYSVGKRAPQPRHMAASDALACTAAMVSAAKPNARTGPRSGTSGQQRTRISCLPPG